ncbi:MAG: ABC transporter ATP-binding protein [Candidatus Eisenbacteria bacterium]|nr:ABC transporter ATP-binding protein [Candidatus Eisenbacteria bacterium]
MIRLDRIEKTFRTDFLRRRRPALRGLSLHVRRGETYALLGANGAGKTTTMKILLDLIRPDRGTAEVNGVSTRDPRSRARLGYLPEHPYFFPHLTGGELVRYYGRLSGLDRGEAERSARRWIERMGLSKAEHRRVLTYSKGMLQRIGFAQALVAGPEILVLDEPLSGLDPIGRKELRELMQELKGEGVTMLLSSHILEDVERICDRAGFLVDGRIVREVEGSEARWIEVSAEGFDPEALRAGDTAAERIVRVGEAVRIALRREEDLPRLRERVAVAGGRITAVETRRESLEQLYVENVQARVTAVDRA